MAELEALVDYLEKTRRIGYCPMAQVYGPFTHEELVGEALEPVRD